MGYNCIFPYTGFILCFHMEYNCIFPYTGFILFISKVHTNNGIQLVVQAHIFHILVSVDDATSPHWGTKAAFL